MATSIPSAFSYEMLSRLPPNSFVVYTKEVRPDTTPVNNRYDLNQQHSIRFTLRASPNEFMLNTNTYLCGTARLNVKVAGADEVIDVASAITDNQLETFVQSASAGLHAPIHYFSSSRESFNSGALPYLDNQDSVRSHEINELRYRLARRNQNSTGRGLQDLEGAVGNDTYRALSLDYDKGEYQIVNGVRLGYWSATAGEVVVQPFGSDKKFQIPLGTYSNLVNSHSVIPLGLMSSYSVNGWSIELKTQVQSNTSGDGPVFSASTNFTGFADADHLQFAKASLQDVKIYMTVVKILDPAVMEAILGLYEKREQVSVGGVQFPLSLRMNSVGYRFSNFPIYQGQSDYYFRVTGTDRSVRAVAWWIYDKNNSAQGRRHLSSGENVKVYRLETSVGTEHVHDVIEDTSDNTNNVANFVCTQAKRSGALFSPLPYYQEGRKHDGQQDDYLASYNNINGTYIFNQALLNSVAYGVISMENLDRREGDYSGSFQASGKDLTNVGAIDIRMRIAQAQGSKALGTTSPSLDDMNDFPQPLAPQSNNYEILFAYVYDSIHEISPQGVMDISSASL